MKNITIPVFQIHELSPRAQEAARSTVRNAYVYDDLNISLMTCFARVLFDAGYPTTDIEYSLSNCQGDGVAFYTPKRAAHLPAHLRHLERDDVDLPRLWVRRGLWRHFTKDQRRIMYQYWEDSGGDVTVEITRNSFGYHYSHSNTMYVGIDCRTEDSSEEDALVTKLVDVIREDVRSISGDLETVGYRITEDLTDDAAVDAIADEQELFFYADGRLAPA